MRFVAFLIASLGLACGSPSSGTPPDADPNASDQSAGPLDLSLDGGATTDGALADATAVDGALDDSALPSADLLGVSIDLDALPEGTLAATPSVTKQVIRIPANDAPASDSETVLQPGTTAPVAAWRWRVWPSDAPAGSDTPAQRYAARVFESFEATPTFVCPANLRQAYDVELTISDGTVRSSFRSRRLIVCTLPRTPAGRTVIDLDLTAGSTSSYCDGKLGGNVVQPGTLVRVSGAITRSWSFWNLTGTADAPIHIVNVGKVTNSNATRLLHCYNCQHVLIDGLGADAEPYGIVLSNNTSNASQAVFFKAESGSCAASPKRGLLDLEVFGVHVAQNYNGSNAGGAGIEINTRGDTVGSDTYSRDTGWEVTGNPATGRPGVAVHHNLVENTYNEGFYIGFTVDWNSDSYDDIVTPYQMRGTKLFRNTIRNTGKDGFQVCNARAMEVHDNDVYDTAVLDAAGHQSSLQINSGCEGAVFANNFKGGRGLNLQSGCTGDDLFFYSNVVERGTLEPGNSLYFKAGITPDVHAHFFLNTMRLDDNHLAVLNVTDPGCFADVGSQSGMYFANNLLVMAAARDVLSCSCDTTGNCDGTCRCDRDCASPEPAAFLDNNLRVTDVNDAGACFLDPATDDFRVCATSTAAAQTGSQLDSVGLIVPSALPLGAFTDRVGRVRANPRGYGAYQ